MSRHGYGKAGDGLTPEQATRRIEALQELSLELAVAQTVDEVADVVARHTTAATGAAGAALWLLGRDGRAEPAAAAGSLAALELPAPDFASFTADDPLAVRPWLSDELAAALRRTGTSRMRTATLFAGSHPVGALALVFEGDSPDDDAVLLGTIVRPAAEAIARARGVAEALELAAIVESTDDAVLATTLDSRIYSWNAGAERLYGYSAAEAIGQRTMILIPGGRQDPAVLPALERLRAGGPAQKLEVERVRKDGRHVIVALTLSPMRNPAGELVGISATARDITDQRAAEQRIRRLAAAVESSPDAIVVAEPDATITEWNAGAEALFGYTRAEAVGRDVTFLSGPEQSDELVSDLRDLAAGRPVLGATRPVRRKDGSLVLTERTAYPVRGPDGEVSAIVAVIHDITQRVRLAEELRRAQRLEALGRLAGGVAHDFNNLLTVISGYGKLARDHLPEGEGVAALDEALAAADRAQVLTGQLLAFARSQTTELVGIPLQDVVDGVLPMLRQLLGDNIAVALAAEPGIPPVRGDRGQLEQLVVNLALNARDAMPGGGEIRFAIDSTSSAGDDPAGDDPGRYVRMIVADTGEGMSEETLAHAFEPFYSTKADGTGTGLGLATVHGIVTQAGGRVTIDSELGRGTAFTILLPVDLSAGAAPEQRPRASTQASAPGSELILLCEDQEAVRELMRRILASAGYSVLEAATADEALALAAATPEGIDALVTDVLMPGIEGPELARRLAAIRPGLRVLFVSGYAPDEIAVGERTGATALLEKPFDAPGLCDAVRALLDRE